MIRSQLRLLRGDSPLLLGGLAFIWAWLSTLVSSSIPILSQVSTVDTAPGTVSWSAAISQPGHLAALFSTPFAIGFALVQVRAALRSRGGLALLAAADARWSKFSTLALWLTCIATGVAVSSLWGQSTSALARLRDLSMAFEGPGSASELSRPTTLALTGVAILGGSIGAWLGRARNPLVMGGTALCLPLLGSQLPWLLERTSGQLAIEAVLLGSTSVLLALATLAPLGKERLPIDLANLLRSGSLAPSSNLYKEQTHVATPTTTEPMTPSQAAAFERRSRFSFPPALLFGAMAIPAVVFLYFGDATTLEDGASLSFPAWLAGAMLGPAVPFPEEGFAAILLVFMIAEVIAILAASKCRDLRSAVLYPYSRRDISMQRFRCVWSTAARYSVVTFVAGSAIGFLALQATELTWQPGPSLLLAGLVLGIGITPWLSLIQIWVATAGPVEKILGFLLLTGGAGGAAPTIVDLVRDPTNLGLFALLGLAMGILGWPALYGFLAWRRSADRVFGIG